MFLWFPIKYKGEKEDRKEKYVVRCMYALAFPMWFEMIDRGFLDLMGMNLKAYK